jgi:hypothetical protein
MMATVAPSILPPRAQRRIVDRHAAMPDSPKAKQAVCHALMEVGSRAMGSASPVSGLSIAPD